MLDPPDHAGSLDGPDSWLNWLSLGYEASGSGLRRLGLAPLYHLTSASVWEVVVYGALHLSRLSRARRISFTDWFTGVRGSPRAGAGKILPRPRRTVGGEKAGRPEPYTGGTGREPPPGPLSKCSSSWCSSSLRIGAKCATLPWRFIRRALRLVNDLRPERDSNAGPTA